MARPSVHIVDDDEDICREVSCALQASGYECSWATSADRMMQPESRASDILLLDLNLPHMDGFQIINRLASEARPPRLIVASGHQHRIIEAAVRHATEVGLDVLGSLEKPFAIRSLLTLLENPIEPARGSSASQTALIRELSRTDALERHMQTAFQSKRRLTDGAIVGYEALIRVTLGNLSINPEMIFAPGVDLDTQLKLTQMVIDDALRFASNLRNIGATVPVSVNCTPAILCMAELPEMIFEALDRSQMPASSLIIEITEQTDVQSFDSVKTAACRLALHECGISVDDFGRGTTSLERLFELPLTELKIDKEIFWKCIDGREPAGLLREVVRYCEDRKIVSVVEGIETDAHLQEAITLGARYGQGYLWDRPSVDGRVSKRRSDALPSRAALR